VHQWLADEAHAAQKESALREIWSETGSVWTEQSQDSYIKVRARLNKRRAAHHITPPPSSQDM